MLKGTAGLRARVLAEPLLFLKAHREMLNEPPAPLPAEELLKDLDLLGAVARRTLRRFTKAAGTLSPEQRAELARATEQALADLTRLHRRLGQEEETTDALLQPAHGDPGAARQAHRHPPDRPHPEDLSSGRCGG